MGSNKSTWKQFGTVLGAAAILAVGASFYTSTSQEAPIWRKVGQVIQSVPLSLGLTTNGALTLGTNDFATSTEAQLVRITARKDMAKVVSTPTCSIQTPNATSSVVGLGIHVGNPATTTGLVKAYLAATATATTTALASFDISADVPYSGFASTTQNAWNNIAPNQFINFGYEKIDSTFLGHGECAVDFRAFASSTPL